MPDATPDVEDLRRQLAAAQREAAEYREQVHALTERTRNMTSAASSAAATTVTAIERIQEMDLVVKAAEAWADGGSHAALTDAVKAWRKKKAKWS